MFNQNPLPKLPSNIFKRHVQNSQIIKSSENSQFQFYITYMSLLLDFGYFVHKVLDPKIYRASIPGLPYAIFTIVLQYHYSPLPSLATVKKLTIVLQYHLKFMMVLQLTCKIKIIFFIHSSKTSLSLSLSTKLKYFFYILFLVIYFVVQIYYFNVLYKNIKC